MMAALQRDQPRVSRASRGSEISSGVRLTNYTKNIPRLMGTPEMGHLS